MSLSASKLRFLIDENVRIDFCRFLKKNLFSVKLVTKGISDSKVAEISKSEKRILCCTYSDEGKYLK